MFSNRCGDIRETDMPRAPLPGTIAQNRHSFASVICAAPAGVIAVVGGQDQQIIIAQLWQHLRVFLVKPLKRAGIA